jgi:hypothetical protein
MSSSAEPFHALLRRSSQLWRGRELARVDARSTGYTALDAKLPGGGWPIGTLIEITPAYDGMGELKLIVPALKSWCQDGRSVAFVCPPHIPYAPALARCGLLLSSLLWVVAANDEDGRWAAEQLLREGAAAVLLWSTAREDRALRRLQLAAEAGKACAFLYRPPGTLTQASPAAIRIALSAAAGGVSLDLIKVRGGHPGRMLLSLDPPPT